MSWISDLLDTGSSFVDSNKDWLKPVANIVGGAFKQSNVDNSQSAYIDYLKQRENKNYADAIAAAEQYNAEGAAAAQASAANRAAAAGRANAAAGAARATEANRQKAAKKANKYTQTMYKKLLGMYEPYKQTADTLLPQMSQTYQNSLGLQNALASFVNSPAQTAKLNAAMPAYQIDIPLPDSVRIR